MVREQYDHIWDSCCDHGLLGAALLSKGAAPHIHFVDVVPELMSQLENKLAHFFPDNLNLQWQVHCMDAAELPLQEVDGKHLVIIAGVGGDLMGEIVKRIVLNNPAADYDFLLCPVHHQFTLRQQLIQLNFGLRAEALIVENERFYEVLLVSKAATKLQAKINAVGSFLWQSDTPEQLKITTEYLNRTLEHYKRVQLNSGAEVQHIIDAYSAVIL